MYIEHIDNTNTRSRLSVGSSLTVAELAKVMAADTADTTEKLSVVQTTVMTDGLKRPTLSASDVVLNIEAVKSGQVVELSNGVTLRRVDDISPTENAIVNQSSGRSSVRRIVANRVLRSADASSESAEEPFTVEVKGRFGTFTYPDITPPEDIDYSDPAQVLAYVETNRQLVLDVMAQVDTTSLRYKEAYDHMQVTTQSLIDEAKGVNFCSFLTDGTIFNRLSATDEETGNVVVGYYIGAIDPGTEITYSWITENCTVVDCTDPNQNTVQFDMNVINGIKGKVASKAESFQSILSKLGGMIQSNTIANRVSSAVASGVTNVADVYTSISSYITNKSFPDGGFAEGLLASTTGGVTSMMCYIGEAMRSLAGLTVNSNGEWWSETETQPMVNTNVGTAVLSFAGPAFTAIGTILLVSGGLIAKVLGAIVTLAGAICQAVGQFASAVTQINPTYHYGCEDNTFAALLGEYTRVTIPAKYSGIVSGKAKFRIVTKDVIAFFSKSDESYGDMEFDVHIVPNMTAFPKTNQLRPSYTVYPGLSFDWFHNSAVILEPRSGEPDYDFIRDTDYVLYGNGDAHYTEFAIGSRIKYTDYTIDPSLHRVFNIPRLGLRVPSAGVDIAVNDSGVMSIRPASPDILSNTIDGSVSRGLYRTSFEHYKVLSPNAYGAKHTVKDDGPASRRWLDLYKSVISSMATPIYIWSSYLNHWADSWIESYGVNDTAVRTKYSVDVSGNPYNAVLRTIVYGLVGFPSSEAEELPTWAQLVNDQIPQYRILFGNNQSFTRVQTLIAAMDSVDTREEPYRDLGFTLRPFDMLSFVLETNLQAPDAAVFIDDFNVGEKATFMPPANDFNTVLTGAIVAATVVVAITATVVVSKTVLAKQARAKLLQRSAASGLKWQEADEANSLYNEFAEAYKNHEHGVTKEDVHTIAKWRDRTYKRYIKHAKWTDRFYKLFGYGGYDWSTQWADGSSAESATMAEAVSDNALFANFADSMALEDNEVASTGETTYSDGMLITDDAGGSIPVSTIVKLINPSALISS